MDIKYNIVLSIILHIILFALSFSVNFRERSSPLPEKYIKVLVVEETETITSMTSFSVPPQRPSVNSVFYTKSAASPELDPDNIGFFSNTPNGVEIKEKIKQNVDKSEVERSKENITILVNHHAGVSEEKNLLNSNTKENESNPYESPENPPTSPFNKGGQERGVFNKGGQREITFSKEEQKGIEAGIERGKSGNEIIESTKKETIKSDTSLYSLIRTAIDNAKTYPFLARKRGMEGTVIVSFSIDMKGLPQDIKIIKSSGYKILDDHVLKILRNASPFPEIKEEIVIPVTFRLRESISDR